MLHTFQKLHIIDAVNFNSFVPRSCKSAHDYGGHLGEGKEERGSENALLNAPREDRIVLQGESRHSSDSLWLTGGNIGALKTAVCVPLENPAKALD